MKQMLKVAEINKQMIVSAANRVLALTSEVVKHLRAEKKAQGTFSAIAEIVESPITDRFNMIGLGCDYPTAIDKKKGFDLQISTNGTD